jgi:2-iminoacetate synthase ThiH
LRVARWKCGRKLASAERTEMIKRALKLKLKHISKAAKTRTNETHESVYASKMNILLTRNCSIWCLI